MKNFLFLIFTVSSLSFARSQTTPEINNIALFLQDGVEILDFAGPMEVFIQAGFNVYTVSVTKKPIKAMGALTIIPDYTLEDCPEPDILTFYGGGGATTKSKKEPILSWVKETAPKADIQFSVCTGAFFLGEAGYLDGKTATTFHTLIGTLRDRFPNADVRSDVRFVDNGSTITTAGISAGIDGSLHLVSKIHGEAYALSVAENMEYDKWIPGEGLVFENPFIKQIREKGMAKALKMASDKTVVYKGELLNLGMDLLEHKKQKEALAVLDYVAEKYTLNYIDCSTLSTAYQAAGRKAPPTEKEFLDMVRHKEFSRAMEVMNNTKSEHPNWMLFREWKMNLLGYEFMTEEDLEAAIEVFKLNVKAFPEGFNTYDSLGEAYMIAGEKEKAIHNYEKSIELNPENDNGKEMLKKLRSAP